MRRVSLVGLLVAWPLAAHADRGELALHLDAGPAVLRVADFADADPGATATTAGARLTIRGTYGLSNALALEASAGAVTAFRVRIPDQTAYGTTIPGTERRTDLGLRVTAGATARLGARWIPTVTAFVGYQHRLLLDVAYLSSAGTVIPMELPSRSASDFLLGIGVGLDYRLGASWVVGMSIQVVHAFSTAGQSYDAIEIPLSAGRYWYPVARRSTDFLPGGQPLR